MVERAGIGERHRPVLLVIDLVDLDVVGLQRDGEIAVHRRIVEKIRFDDFGLVAEAENEILKAVMRIGAHDVPQDRMISDRHHGLGANFGFLAQPRAEAAAQDENRNFGGVHEADLSTLGDSHLARRAGCENETPEDGVNCGPRQFGEPGRHATIALQLTRPLRPLR